MDERAVGMTSSGDGDSRLQPPAPGTVGAPTNASETAAQLEDDIEHIRNHLTEVASELDRRRHRLFDLPGQARDKLRKHARPIAFGTLGLTALGLGLWWWRSRSRRGTVAGQLWSAVRDRLPEGLTSGDWLDAGRRRLAEAIHPMPPSHPVRSGVIRISTAGAAAAASVLGKRLAGRLATDQAG